MGTKEKLIERFKKQPTDFTWDELVRLFGFFGYEISHKGKTGGSRAIFKKGDSSHTVHKPHPGNVVKSYEMKKSLTFLVNQELI